MKFLGPSSRSARTSRFVEAMRLNGTTRAILRRPLTNKQWNTVEMLPEHLRLSALWRTLKFNHPWPRHRGRQCKREIID
jgi:hypothetical protein